LAANMASIRMSISMLFLFFAISTAIDPIPQEMSHYRSHSRFAEILSFKRSILSWVESNQKYIDAPKAVINDSALLIAQQAGVSASQQPNATATTIVDAVQFSLLQQYPGLKGLLGIDERSCYFNWAGYQAIHCCFIFATFTEYVQIYGTNFGVQKYGGIFNSKFQLVDYVVSGQLWVELTGQLEPTNLKAGQNLLVPGDPQNSLMAPGTWVLEHAVGSVPLSTFWWSILSPAFFETSDFGNVRDQVCTLIKLIVLSSTGVPLPPECL